MRVLLNVPCFVGRLQYAGIRFLSVVTEKYERKVTEKGEVLSPLLLVTKNSLDIAGKKV